MAVYDLEEQEQLDDLKAWWKQWGNTIAGVVDRRVRRRHRRAGLALVVSSSRPRRLGRSTAPSAPAARANDVPKAKDAMAQLADKFGGTGYAPRAALVAREARCSTAGDKAGREGAARSGSSTAPPKTS